MTLVIRSLDATEIIHNLTNITVAASRHKFDVEQAIKIVLTPTEIISYLFSLSFSLRQDVRLITVNGPAKEQ